MPREGYQDELDGLRAAVVDLGEDVAARLEDALVALEDGDDDLARSVIEGDDAINERYLQLEQNCIDLLALQQPVAGDLRFVAASFKIITDLERIADLAVNLAEYALAGDDTSLDGIDRHGIGTLAHDLVVDAVDAYESADPDACRAVAARDDELDALCQRAGEQVVRDLISREVDAGDSWAVESLMDDVSRVLLTVRDLERVGDHAVNVAARTLYMAETDSELIY